jgi:hypothetical protein
MGAWTGTVPSFPVGKLRAADMTTVADILTALTGSWTSFTPTFTNLVLGNGTCVTAYRQLGKTVDYRGRIDWGASTSASGTWNISLPVTPFVTPSGVGAAFLSDASSGNSPPGVAALFSTIVFFASGTGNVNATVPFAWAVGDNLTWYISYEVS